MGSDLEEQLGVWSKMASSLAEKLKVADDDNDSLKRRLQNKEDAYENLQEELNYKSARVVDLEQQCKEKSAKNTELWENVQARAPGEVEEKLLIKSLQNADYSLLIDKLRLQEQEAASDMETLKKQCADAKKENYKLELKIKAAIASRDRMISERDGNKKMLLELGDVVRTLNRVSVTYDKQESSSDFPATSEHSIKNIKRKIGTIEKDRQLLCRENESLQEENEEKNRKIAALEAQFHLLNITRIEGEVNRDLLNNESDDLIERPEEVSTTAPEKAVLDICHITTIVEEEESRTELSEENIRIMIINKESLDISDSGPSDDASSASYVSDDSSFSSIDPPEIPVEEYQKLRREHEQALTKLVLLKKDLEKASKKERQEAATLAFVLPEMEILKLKYEAALNRIRNLDQKLNAADEKMDQETQDRKNELDAVFTSHSTKYENLQKEREDLESKYDDLLEEYEAVLQRKNKQFEDLKEEYDAALDIHTSAENELQEIHRSAEEEIRVQFETLMQKYKSALLKITSLEDQLLAADDAGPHSNDYDLLLADYSELEKKREKESEKYRILKQDHEVVSIDFCENIQKLIAANKKTEEETGAKYGKLKQEHNLLADNYARLEQGLLKPVPKAGQAITDHYMKLEKLYDSALVKIASLEQMQRESSQRGGMGDEERHQLQNIGMDDSTVVREGNGALDKIIALERALHDADSESDGSDSESADEHEANEDDAHKHSFDVVLTNLKKLEYQLLEVDQESKVSEANQNRGADEDKAEEAAEGEGSFDWLYRLFHQDKLRPVHASLVEKFESSLECHAEDAPDNGSQASEDAIDRFVWFDQLLHQGKLRRVNSSILESRGELLESKGASANEDHYWMHRLHQGKLRLVNQAILNKFCTSEVAAPDKSPEENQDQQWLNLLLHQIKLRHVNHSVVAHFKDAEERPIMDFKSSVDVCTNTNDDYQALQEDTPVDIEQASHKKLDQETDLALTIMKGELKKAKTVAEAARLKQESREQDLRCVMVEYKKLMQSYESEVSKRATKDTAKLRAIEPNTDADVSPEDEIKPSDEGSLAELTNATIGKLSVQTQRNVDQVLADECEESDDADHPPGLPSAIRMEKQSQASSVSGSIVSLDEKNDEAIVGVEIQFEAEIQLEHALTLAEAKVAMITQELKMAKEEAEETRTEQKTQEEDLKTVLGQYKQLKKEHALMSSKIQLLESQKKVYADSVVSASGKEELESSLREIIRQYRELEKQHQATLERIKTFESTIPSQDCATVSSDGSVYQAQVSNVFRRIEDMETADAFAVQGKDLINVNEVATPGVIISYSSSLDVSQSSSSMGRYDTRDEKADHNLTTVSALEKYLQIKQEHVEAMKKISTFEQELNTSKQVAQEAKKKQVEREQHLRDVIFHYKKLQKEHEDLVADHKQDTKTESGILSPSIRNKASPWKKDSYHKLKQEHEATVAKMSDIEKELDAAKLLVDETKMKQTERESHLRDVIYQYKKLERELSVAKKGAKESKRGLAREPREEVEREDSDGMSRHQPNEIVLYNTELQSEPSAGRSYDEMANEREGRLDRKTMLAEKIGMLLEKNEINKLCEGAKTARTQARQQSWRWGEPTAL
jgi:hypothetical protein